MAAASSSVRFGRFSNSRKLLPDEKLCDAELGDDDGVRAELADQRLELVAEAAHQRRHADDRRHADHDAEHRQERPELVGPERPQRHRDDLGEQAGAYCHRCRPNAGGRAARPDESIAASAPGSDAPHGCGHHSYLRASIGSRRDAFMAGHIPKKMPTRLEKPRPRAKDHHGSDTGKPANVVDDVADGAAEQHAEHAADRREDDGLDEELHEDLAAACPERLADADLARPLGDRDRHDGHHPDAAHHQRDRRDDDQGQHDGPGEVGRGSPGSSPR